MSASPNPSAAVSAPTAAAAFPALDPVKAEKLNERFNRAPGASASVGFDESSSSLNSAPRSMTAVWNDGENKSPSKPLAAPAPSTPSANSRGGEEELEEDAGDVKRQKPDFEDDSDEFSLGKLNKKKRVGNRFSQEEDDMLLAKQSELGSNWKLIVQQSSGDLASRTPGSISKRFAHLQSKRPVATTTTSATKPSSFEPIEEDEVQIVDPSPALLTASAVKPVAAAAVAAASTASTPSTFNTSLETFGFTSSRPSSQVKEELDRIKLELEKASRERQLFEDELTQRGKELEVVSRESKQRKERSCEVFQSILRHQDEQEALKSRKAALENSLLFGRYTVLRTGMSQHPKEVFEDGSVKRELDAKRNQLLATKLELEKKRPSKRQQQQQPSLEAVMEERAMEEVRQSKLSKYKRDTEELSVRADQYRSDRMLHQRELRRIQHEDSSKFSTRPVLKNRYLLRQLLGKGGFSEVWKAFDFESMRDVAVKIHDLDPSWTEERKANYLKHAKREYEIHAAIRHPRIAQLYGLIDHIEGSNNSFATVMEFCPSLDLDCVLKRQQRLGEKEAKCILIQILSGLLHLSNGAGIKNSLGIIHFDIKPANILFDGDGSVKITDFGLSKIVTDDNMETFDGGIELTSQGAGTYWYLPPECFNFDRKNPPNISSKVDVFSAGVVFYQMLYGVRPFGEGKTQEGMLKEGTMTGALRVHFPDKPVVSEAAKDFINRCLTHSQDLRPDMTNICSDPYLKNKPGKTSE